jgi:hypothetical protein
MPQLQQTQEHGLSMMAAFVLLVWFAHALGVLLHL